MALDCKTLTAVGKQCMLGVGGAKKILVFNQSDLNPATIASCQATGVIDDDDFDALFTPTATGVKGVEWECLKDTIIATASLQVNNGQRGFNHSVSGTFQGSPLKGDNALNSVLADIVFIVQDNSGSIKLYGADNGMQFEAYEDTTGTTQQDLNGTTWTASGYQISMPLEVTGVTWAEVVAKIWKTT